MQFSWLNDIKDGVVSKAADAAAYIQAQNQLEEDGGEESEYYDEEEDESGQQNNSASNGPTDTQEPDPVRKQAVELRLIVKQVQFTLDKQGEDQSNNPYSTSTNKARVTFCRNTKKNKVMATDWKSIDQQTGLCLIKQSFNCKLTMLFDNERSVWVSDYATLGIQY